MTDDTKANNAQRAANSDAAITNSLAAQQAAVEQKSGAIAPRSSNLITNPGVAADPGAPVPESKPSELPQSTIDEMAAGKKALERNRPVAQALEAAREPKSS